MHRSRHRALVPIVLVAVSGLLVGCTGEDGADAGATTHATLAPVTATESVAPSDATGGELAAAQSAIAAAEAAHPGRAVKLDHEDSGEWKVDVFADDALTEVRVSADGGTVVRAEGPEPAEADDLDEIGALAIPLGDAIATAVTTVPGTIDEAQLEDYTTPDGGASGIGIEVDVVVDGARQSVIVDASTGQVVFTRTGD